MKWTIQITYDARDDNGKILRARTVTWVEADDIPEAYAAAEVFLPDGAKLGAIVNGHHVALP